MKPHERARKWKYGLTPHQFSWFWNEQDGSCAICCTPLVDGQNVHVDHDHKTKAVRGLLCFNCNTGIGHLRDNPTLLRTAARYLEERGALALYLQDSQEELIID
jgi:hypothetical protein